MKKVLNPGWIIGYRDGSFMINVSKSKTCRIGYSTRLVYQLVAHISDK
jgi:hypothetical protein